MAGAPAIGIDLGTTFSCVAVQENGKVTVIPNEKGNRITPSMVAFTEEGRSFGEDAKPYLNINHENTVYGIKRLMGKEFCDNEVKIDIKSWPFKVVNKNKRPTIQIKQKGETKEYIPEEISGMVLGKMKIIAETYLKQPVVDAVITVPAYFNDAQRQATIDAGVIAGLNVLRVISEPTAAAVAYGMDRIKKKKEEKILVYDLGGGTFDVSILRLDDGIFEVMSTSGDTHLGGHDFDEKMVEHFAEEYKKKHAKDIRQDVHAMVRLRSACEQAKHKLSAQIEAQVEIDNLHDQNDFEGIITRDKFEKLNKDLFSKTIDGVKQALADAKMKPSKVDEVILVGGATRIPKIQELVMKHFKIRTLNKSINPEEAVAVGAATLAARLSGATYQDMENMVLLDVIPISLGIELYDRTVCTIIPRNSTIPTEQKRYASTERDNQTQVFVKVLQGENPRAADNRVLGTFILDKLPRQKAGEVNIEVTYEVDVNGILKCTAEEESKGTKKSITIKNEKGNLSKEEIRRMNENQQKQSKLDAEVLGKVEARCLLEEHANSVMKFAGDVRYKDRVNKQTIAKVISRCNDALFWLQIDVPRSKADYENKLTELEEVTKPFTSKIFKGKQEFKMNLNEPLAGASGELDLD